MDVRKSRRVPFCVLLHFYDQLFQALSPCLTPPPPRVHLLMKGNEILRHNGITYNVINHLMGSNLSQLTSPRLHT
jgi:hypothetical protein